MEASDSNEAKRLVWCTAGGAIIHGSTSSGPAPPPNPLQRLFHLKPRGSMAYTLDSVTLPQAERALAAFLEAPGAFKIETAGGGSIDLLASRWSQWVTLDCWFFDTVPELDTHAVGRGDVVELIRCIFSTTSDETVARCVVRLEERAAKQRDAADKSE